MFLKFIYQAIYFKACIVENNTFNNARTDLRIKYTEYAQLGQVF